MLRHDLDAIALPGGAPGLTCGRRDFIIIMQKNAELIRRIILTSSNPGDLVLDCFAGSGETLVQAQKLGRHFIGLDISPAAQKVIKKRL